MSHCYYVCWLLKKANVLVVLFYLYFFFEVYTRAVAQQYQHPFINGSFMRLFFFLYFQLLCSEYDCVMLAMHTHHLHFKSIALRIGKYVEWFDSYNFEWNWGNDGKVRKRWMMKRTTSMWNVEREHEQANTLTNLVVWCNENGSFIEIQK